MNEFVLVTRATAWRWRASAPSVGRAARRSVWAPASPTSPPARTSVPPAQIRPGEEDGPKLFFFSKVFHIQTGNTEPKRLQSIEFARPISLCGHNKNYVFSYHSLTSSQTEAVFSSPEHFLTGKMAWQINFPQRPFQAPNLNEKLSNVNNFNISANMDLLKNCFCKHNIRFCRTKNS